VEKKTQPETNESAIETDLKVEIAGILTDFQNKMLAVMKTQDQRITGIEESIGKIDKWAGQVNQRITGQQPAQNQGQQQQKNSTTGDLINILDKVMQGEQPASFASKMENLVLENFSLTNKLMNERIMREEFNNNRGRDRDRPKELKSEYEHTTE
jgi:hypothetical protein